jgi:hypothetical protein
VHGQYIRSIDRQLISEEDTFLRLSKRDLKAETESEIVAGQCQALQTKYATKILQRATDSKCRVCRKFNETIGHIISACPILPKEQYTKHWLTQGGGGGLPGCSPLKVKFKKHKFCRHDYTNGFTSFTLQLKSASEIG